MTESGGVQIHRFRAMSGRDPLEPHRVSSPLELLYDLTIVVAFSLAGSQFAHALIAGHILAGIVGFAVSMFAITLAWIGYSWFASAYDNDDVFMRLATLVQMVGVLVLALGLHSVFEGFEHREFNNAVVVAGYVTMRVSLVALWLRAARHDPLRRSTCLAFARLIFVAQIGWVISACDLLPTAVNVVLTVVLFVSEVAGTAWITLRYPSTPWHPHHIAERYGLLAIITLGEIVLGTTTAVEAVVSGQGWTLNAGAVAFAGITLAVGMWWCYFALPFGTILEHRTERALLFGFGHLVMYAAIAGTGAGLHVAAYFVEGHIELSEAATMLSVVLPLALFVLALVALDHLVLPGRVTSYLATVALSIVVLAAALVCGAVKAPIWLCLSVATLSPWVIVIGFELGGYRHLAARLDNLIGHPTGDAR